MIVLDTDHFNVLQIGKGTSFDTLVARMDASIEQDFATTVITFEEHMRGWLAEVRRARQRIRIGTLDLKVASISLQHAAILLSANANDFNQVPGLQVEDWMH